MRRDYKLNSPQRFRPVGQLAFRVLMVLAGVAAIAEAISLTLNPAGGSGRGLSAAGYILALFFALALIVLAKRAGDARRRWGRTSEVGDDLPGPAAGSGHQKFISMGAGADYAIAHEQPGGADSAASLEQ